jgi:ATP-dependent Clp protease ATP-binding subunit ClpC
MWQRFSEAARKAVFYAQEEAQKVGEGYVGTEHMLLGILREPDSTGAKALVKMGLSLSQIREDIVRQLPKGSSRPSPDMTLTPRCKRAIDLAYAEARELNNNYIGTEHLLLGFIAEKDGLAAKVLAHLGVDLDRARPVVAELIADRQLTEPASPKPERRDIPSASRAWHVLAARNQRMMADQLCLMFLFEKDGIASEAISGLGGTLSLTASLIEEEILEVKSPEQLAAGFMSASDLLSLADGEAKELGQVLNAAHFLLASLHRGDTATARALAHQGIAYEGLKGWIAQNPQD